MFLLSESNLLHNLKIIFDYLNLSITFILKKIKSEETMLKSIFSKHTSTDKKLKLKFSKEDNSWLVLKGHSIMFIGREEQCKTYISNFS